MNKATAYVKIKCGVFNKYEFSFYFLSFTDFKISLLKRFGNLSGTSRGNRYKEKVKNIIRSAENFEDIREIECGGWGFEIRVSL